MRTWFEIASAPTAPRNDMGDARLAMTWRDEIASAPTAPRNDMGNARLAMTWRDEIASLRSQ